MLNVDELPAPTVPGGTVDFPHKNTIAFRTIYREGGGNK